MPAGGCITAYRWRNGQDVLDLLRPAVPDGLPLPGDTGCFPLVPYSNRIRDGHYRFAGRDFRLAKNFAPSPHSIHGHGWKVPWQLAEQSARHITLTYSHAENDWPAPYRSEQRFELADGALNVILSITNEGAEDMPAGLGLHPYFPRSPECRVSATVDRMWTTDGEVMPTGLVAPKSGADPNCGLNPDQTALDNCFTGFGGEAVILWPERNARLTLTADSVLDYLVIFTPPGQDFFCVEPVSHSTDALNLAPEAMKVLRPGETFRTKIRFQPEWVDPA